MRAWIAAGIALISVACSERVLVLPELDGAKQWLVVAAGDTITTRVDLLSSVDAAHVDLAGVDHLEALGYTHDIGLPTGRIPSVSDGERVPTPSAAYAANLDDLSWNASSPSSPSPVIVALRLPPGPDDCPQYTMNIERLVPEDSAGVRDSVELTPSVRLVYTSSAWFRVTETESRAVPVLIRDIHAVTLDPSGAVWASSKHDLYVISNDNPPTVSLERRLPHEFDVRSIAIPKLGLVYGLTANGILFRSDTSTTTIVHRFTVGGAEYRGMVTADGAGIVAGFATDPTLVQIEDDVITPATIPGDTGGEGVVSIARFREYGLVVGTSLGSLRSERDEYRELPDRLGALPRGVPIIALRSDGQRLYFGGRRVFGEVTPRGFICQSRTTPPLNVRTIEPFDGQIAVAGIPIDSLVVNLLRFTVTQP